MIRDTLRTSGLVFESAHRLIYKALEVVIDQFIKKKKSII